MQQHVLSRFYDKNVTLRTLVLGTLALICNSSPHTYIKEGFETPTFCRISALIVPLKCKLPRLIFFLARCVSFLWRVISFLSRWVSFLSRITEAFSLEYIIHVYTRTRKTLKTGSFHTESRGVLQYLVLSSHILITAVLFGMACLNS